MKKFQFFIKSFVGIFFFILILFIAAGRIDYYQGWIYAGMSVLGLLMSFVKGNAELMSERAKPGENIKSWDKKILGVSALMTLVAHILAGLDAGRFRWSNFPLYYSIAGAVATFIGQLIFLIAKNQNNFFSSVARIQRDRNHTVVSSGLYQIIRHPGYLGMTISWIGFPMITGSMWSAIPSAIAIILLLVRTNLEDTMLANELDGYKDYAKKTRYRLIPIVW